MNRIVENKEYYLIYLDNSSCKITKSIMNNPKGKYVDHLDRNGLNNCKYNLRNVDNSENQRNANVRVDSKTGVKGVYIEDEAYIAFWVDNNKKRHRKMFSFSKHGKEEAFKIAVKLRKEMELKYQYLS